MAHTLAPDFAARDLYAALIAFDALVANALVFAAVALEVLGRTEDLLAEQAVLLRLQRTVVDRLRLGHLAVGPVPDHFRRGERNADGIEIVYFQHVRVFLRHYVQAWGAAGPAQRGRRCRQLRARRGCRKCQG